MESIQEGRGYGVNAGGKGLWSQYRREGVMESIQESMGYGVNTGGKGLWSQYGREGVILFLTSSGHLSDSIRALL